MRESAPSERGVSLDGQDRVAGRENAEPVLLALLVLQLAQLRLEVDCSLTKTSIHGIETTRTLRPLPDKFLAASTQRGTSEPVETRVRSAFSASSRT